MIYLQNESYMLGKAYTLRKVAIVSRHEFLTPDHLLWAIAEQEHLSVPASDMTFKKSL